MISGHRAVAEFLRARVTEDEAIARAQVVTPVPAAAGRPRPSLAWWPKSLTDCQTKRDIVDRCVYYLDNHRTDDSSGEWLAVDVLAYLAQPYATHPEFRPEWTPDA